MGQQQLLLIVLGVIIVGIAIVVGINLFNANAEESTKDSIVTQGTNIGAMAQQYYKKPTALGGGGNNFAGFDTNVFDKLPANLRTSTDATWSCTVTDGADGNVLLTATPNDAGYAERWTVETTVTKDSLVSQVVLAN
jgi:hypothetical protein